MRASSFAFLLVFAVLPAAARQASTNAGGAWSEPTTWIGGTVPTAASGVVINGPVALNVDGVTVGSIEVNSTGTLAASGYYRTLVVTGTVVNHGTIRNDPNGGWHLNLRVGGNLENWGTWQCETTTVIGAGLHTLVQQVGRRWESAFFLESAGVILDAYDDQTFARAVDLGGGTLDTGFATVQIAGGAVIRNGSLQVLNKLEGIENNLLALENVRIAGAAQLDGTIGIGSGVVVDGSLAVLGTGILQASGYYRDLDVNGTFSNDGVVRNDPNGGWHLNISVSGDVNNHGLWQHQTTTLDGGGSLQSIRLGSTSIFESRFVLAGPAERISGASWIRTNQDFNLNGGQLEMGGAPLVLVGSSARVHSGTIDTVGEIRHEGDRGTTLQAVTVLRRPAFGGLVTIGSGVVIDGDLTVNGTLHPAGYHQSITITGDLFNNGTLRDDPNGGWFLGVAIAGDLHNAGTWTFAGGTLLNGTAPQTITQTTGAVFESSFLSGSGTVTPVAGSDLDLARPFDLAGSTIDLGAYTITLLGDGRFFNGRAISQGILQGTGAVFGLESITVSGSPSIAGTLPVRSGVVFEGTLTVDGTLEAQAYYRTVIVTGDLVNNGTIRNDPSGGWYLTLNVTGHVTNLGTWNAWDTVLTGAGPHEIALGAGRSWNTRFYLENGGVRATATTDQTFTELFNLLGGTLDMGGHTLSVPGSAYVENGTILGSGTVQGLDGNEFTFRNIRFVGSITFAGSVGVQEGVRITGSLNIPTGAELHASAYYRQLDVVGSITNHGTIGPGAGGWPLVVTVTGNVFSDGTWSTDPLRLTGSGRRNVWAPAVASRIESTGEEVVLIGENLLSNLHHSGGRLVLGAGGRLELGSGAVPGTAESHGLVVTSWQAPTGTLSGFRTSLDLGTTTPTSLWVEHYGDQVPGTFANAARSWWRFRHDPATSENVPWIQFQYDETQLGANSEALLEVYHSTDGGASWRQVSTSANTTRDTQANWIRLNGALPTGDYVLSSSPDPVSVLPTVIVSLIGRSQIRVGPPNRYTIHYVNNSAIPVGDFEIMIETAGGVSLHSVIPSAFPGHTIEPIPASEYRFAFDPGVAHIYVLGMAPYEERSFDIVLTAVPDPSGKAHEMSDSEAAAGVTLVAAWGWVAPLLKIRSAIAAANALSDLWWRDASRIRNCEEFSSYMWEVFWRAQYRTHEQLSFGYYERPAPKFADEVKKEIARRLGIPESEVGNHWSTIERAFGKEAVARGQSIVDCQGNPLTLEDLEVAQSLQKVTSWDPNEKVGPTGQGALGFVPSVGRMTYQILFENKKEATAPAWRIVIDDTLSTVFDPSTVQFEGSSHQGWTFTVNGNRLQWVIEGIELPPNVVPPEGEGYVQFSVDAVPGLPSGTVLANRAVIVFDLNRPIMTNTVLNTLDFGPPTTVMEAPPATVSGGPLTLRWTASDGAGESGVSSTTVFASTDGGSFEPVGTSHGNSMVVDVAPGHTYRFYALSRDIVGNVEGTLPTAVTVAVVGTGVESEDGPHRFELEQNYPNPFNPVTTMSFWLPETAPAQLVVYDVAGRRVASLVNGLMGAGRHEVQWDAGGLASGVYFCRLQQADRAQTRGMLLVR